MKPVGRGASWGVGVLLLLLAGCGGGSGGSSGGSGSGGAVTSVPGAPTVVAAAASVGGAVVSFQAPAVTGASAIIDYTAECAAGTARFSGTGAASPLAVAGLTNGSAYSCTVTARNAVGSSTASAAATVVPSASATSCALPDRQLWAAAQLREWYLFPETLPATVDVNGFSTVDAVINAMTAGARAQNKDRYFTYLTSIAQENAYYSSGATAGFGVRLYTDSASKRVFITEAFEGAPALAAGIDRGDELLAVGTSVASLRLVSDILTTDGTSGVTTALGPNTAGTTRVLRVRGSAGTRDLTVTKADYNLDPVSTRYGGVTLSDSGRRVGYINLRTFIASADARLREEFLKFRSAGINQLIVDFRYNGGGLVSTGELLGNLLGGNRSSSQLFSQTTFRTEKSANNSVAYFAVQPQSVSPLKIAFIGTRSTASASEMVINGLIPYLNADLALVGENTYGKPVGQIALDRGACDDRLRVIAFSLRNSANSDAYFNGLAGAVKASCTAMDDVTMPLGTAGEGSIRQALDFLAGKSCTAISPAPVAGSAAADRRKALSAQYPDRVVLDLEPLLPDHPGVAQRDVPGLF